ncbi:MAG: hypothetical protein Q8O18_04180, partial [Deltaproteobacteria bacterium]|nr:hypothetical protein [Deltaproteobacteria bacterium]
MRNKKKPGCKKYLRLILFLTVITLFFFGQIDESSANPEPAPISGTPKLHQQKLKLYRDFGTQGTIEAEINRGSRILADVVGQPVSFWAFDFNFPTNDLNGYYPTTAICVDSTRLSTGYYLNIYVENGQNVSTSTIASIRNEFIITILPTETTYFGSPPIGDFTILILDIQDDYDPAIIGST